MVHGDAKEGFPEPELLRGGHATRFGMKAIYTGWMMHASSWFDYVCIVALLAHVTIAVVHSMMTAFAGETSGAWDSMLEMPALAQGSNPPKHPILSNTSAGIQSWKTIKVIAWVEASKEGCEPGQELQL